MYDIKSYIGGMMFYFQYFFAITIIMLVAGVMLFIE
jgi:hypothetical protein